MTTLAGSPPITEIGTEQPLGGMPTGFTGNTVTPWRTFIDTYERTPELIWPKSVETYSEMRNDSQVEGLYYGATLPIRRYNWKIDPNGSREEIYKGIATDFGLPIKGEDAGPVRRKRGRFNWDDTLRHALLSILYGHMFFEQVGYIGDDNRWHLKKLAPRMPETISEIQVAEDGGLVAIKQLVGVVAPAIPVDRLVAFVWDKEGANWAGRSMLRSCFKDYVIKDRLIRVDAQKNERNGMGVPVVEAPANATDKQIKDLNMMSRNFRAGDTSGGAIPNGSKLTLQGTQGNLPDTLASIRARDEAMARRFLMMFMQLGQTTTGSRALGSEFIDWFALAQEALADFICGIIIEHVFEDWVDWNFGEDEELVPQLVYERNDDQTFPVADLVGLINAGAVTVDEEVEDAIRTRFDLPQRSDTTPAPKDTQPPEPPAPDNPETPAPASSSPPPQARATNRRRSRRVELAASAPSSLSLPDRELRRQPYEQEELAGTDFGKLDNQWASAVDKLVGAWGPVRDSQVAQLLGFIKDAKGDLKELANMQADAVGSDVIASHLKKIAKGAAKDMKNEVAGQGVTVGMPTLDAANTALENRAEAVDDLLARSLSEAASRKAIQLTGGALTEDEVADAVGTYLSGLSDSWLRDQFGGALTAAQNAGRKALVNNGPAPKNVYASELLDENTCDPCTAIDGTEYDTMDDAEADYPTGGYMDCDGGPRCRGTLIAVYDEAAPTVEED